MKKVLIVGAGGHAQVVADILMCDADSISTLKVTPVGYLDDNLQILDHKYLGIPVVGSLQKISIIEHDYVVVAIGNNQRRKQIFDQLVSANENLLTVIHPSAIIAPSATIGIGTMICAGAIINPCVTIGNNVIINTGSTIDHHNHIANHVHIAPGVNLGGTVTIEEGAFIGIGASIIPQQHIGEWSTIGAGATIITNIEPNTTYVGTPGRKIQT
jgi:sugar O-acyltransferase (sialic acid O-acetyltransferase NeuD family)